MFDDPAGDQREREREPKDRHVICDARIRSRWAAGRRIFAMHLGGFGDQILIMLFTLDLSMMLTTKLKTAVEFQRDAAVLFCLQFCDKEG